MLMLKDKENPRVTLTGSQGQALRYTERAKLKAQDILADFKVDCNGDAKAPNPDKTIMPIHSNGDGWNCLVFHHFSRSYIKRLMAHNLSSGYIKHSKAVLLGYSRFLETEGIGLIQDTNRQTWSGYTNLLTNSGLSKRTIACNQTVLRQFYRWLKSEGILDTNPFEGLHSPKLDKCLPKFLNVEEAKTLVESPDISTPEGQRDRAILELFYASGIRLSELVGLNLGQISLEQKEMFVLGKGAKERLVLFGKPAAIVLKAYIQEARLQLLNNTQTRAVFINSHGERIAKWAVRRMVSRYSIQALGKRIYPHLLRHTFATHMLDGGADLRVVQELLGHETLATTEIYTHVSLKHLREVYLKAFPGAENKELLMVKETYFKAHPLANNEQTEEG